MKERNPIMRDIKNPDYRGGKPGSRRVVWRRRLGFGSILVIVIVAVGCAQTEQAGKVQTAGFIRDYSLLQHGGEGEALLVYKKPQADFSRYRTVYVEPVIVLLSKQSSVSQEQLDKLGGDLRSKVIWKLKEDFLVVPKLIPGALRVELALTEAIPADVGMDIITTLIPPAGVLSGAAGLATGTKAFVGRASVEGKITDGDTGTLLAAAVDRRMGGRTLDGSMDSWDDVQQAFEYWATKLSQRLREWRATNKPLVDMKE
jgi:hypothetical protein